MILAKIKALLLETIGLHSRSIGDVSIERAIHQRMVALSIQSKSEYWTLLQDKAEEFSELVEEVVVPETWFFRNTSPFDALLEYIPAPSLGSHPNSETSLKILSLPCSTGEEPYSIAMVLMERGLKHGEFSIDAFDISQRVLVKAKRAIYGENSFREEYRNLRSKYFHVSTAGHQLVDAVKRQVSFSTGNIVKDSFVSYFNKYDIIFCRNLLIYFDRKTQSFVLNKLHSLLRGGGVLCVGHAEASLVPKERFQSLNIPMAFAFKKIVMTKDSHDLGPQVSQANPVIRNAQVLKDLESTYKDLVGIVEKGQQVNRNLSNKELSNKELSNKELSNKELSNNAPRVGGDRLTKNAPNKHAQISSSELLVGAVNERYTDTVKYFDLEDISKLVEKGKLIEASEFAESYLNDNPESSEAYYYLGLISHLEGGFQVAESLLKKAIYLDPHHHAAIGLLVVLAQDRGDTGQADAYRKRQQRAILHRSKDD